ncbi:MAG TPA: EamA family transporter [Stellaceae bacterium]|nr:EamA family transporter [Stellaceae bacterium]
MKPGHAALALLVAAIWGIAFVVSKLGLESFTPPQLTALRFLVAALAALWLNPPPIGWGALVAIGLTLFAGQFLLQFFAISSGVPAGLTAILVQTQALFTVAFAALALADRPTARQSLGMLAALVGLTLIGLTLGGGVTAWGVALALASAVSWAIGNILVKRLPPMDMLRLMAWASLVPPLPALALSAVLDGPKAFVASFAAASWWGLAAPLYLGLLASVFAYALWGRLLQLYPAGAVAPYALLAPCVGALASAVVFGERFGPLRLLGMALILAGVAVTALPRRKLPEDRSAAAA